ncbi:MAG: hypothetical protein FWB78_09735 [Treponema sp.]|nr:hypothetical protein [Treponema sp.]
MKQLLAVAGIAAILLSFSACGGTDRRNGLCAHNGDSHRFSNLALRVTGTFLMTPG